MSTPATGVGRLSERLASFYFFYYATVGAFMPYWSPYLEARGFSPAQMGIAYALMGVMRTVVPVGWGWYADRSGQRVGLIRFSSAAALILFLSIPFMPGVFWVGAMMVAYTLFWHALLPQFEVVSLNHLAATGGDYARVRLWGSVGFIVSVMTLGALLDNTGVLWLPWLVGIAWLGIAVVSWSIPEAPVPPSGAQQQGSLMAVLKQPAVIALLLVCFASQLSYAPYYNFFTPLLERHGHPRTYAGLLWSVAVIAEIVLFIYAAPIIRRFGPRRVLIAALGATAVRWLLTPIGADSLLLLVFLQIGHALSFGAYHAVAMHYVQRIFPGAMQGRGQAIYSGVSYGIGGSIGSLSAGYLWQIWSLEGAFYVAAAVAAIGCWVAWRRLPAEKG